MKSFFKSAALAGLLVFAAACGAAKTAPTTGVSIATTGAPDGLGYVKGADTAPITFIEYASPTCGGCAYFHENIKPMLDEKYVKTGKVKFVYRPFPIHQDLDLPMYVLAMCAGDDKFLGVVDDYFEHFSGITQSTQTPGAFDAALREVAARHGIDTPEKFKACMDDRGLRNAMADYHEAAMKHQVSSTPTFVVNGVVHKAEGNYASAEGLAKELDAILAASGK